MVGIMDFVGSPLTGYGSFAGPFIALFVLLAIWSAVWKAFALWRAARLGSKPWFIIFIILNTAGILEIIYLFVISKKNSKSKKR